jgi:hypothetical protein
MTARIAWSSAAALLLGYAAVIIWLSPLALQDFPNHLARTAVLSDLIFHHGAQFGGQFQYHFLPIPYIAGDLILAAAMAVFGSDVTAALWSTLVFLSLPAALLFYLGTTRIANDARALLLILSAYLSIDWFFLMGFLEFRLGIAVTLVTLGVVERIRSRPTIGLFALYCAMLLLGYLTHLTTLIFTTAAIGTVAMFRLLRHATTLRLEAWLLVPCMILLGWHFGFASAYRQLGDVVENPYRWGTLYQKIIGLGAEFVRFRLHPDELMMGALLLCLWSYAGRTRLRDLRDPVVLEMLVLAAMMVGLYFVIPMSYSEACYADVRALPLAALFLIFACLSLPVRTAAQRGSSPSLALWIAVLLAIGNLAYLAKQLGANSAWLTQYRTVIAAIPRGAKVFPIYTSQSEWNVGPLRHTFSFALIDRGAVVPDIQTGDTGNPQKYIRYLHRPYAPLEAWYTRAQPIPVDWSAIGCEYAYLLVTKPFDPVRLRVSVIPVTENESGALFAIPPSNSCNSEHDVNADRVGSPINGAAESHTLAVSTALSPSPYSELP